LCARREAGLTLVELILAMVVIAIALAGTLQLHRTLARTSADAMILAQGAAIAEAYLEEALLRPVFDPDLGPAGGVCPAPEASRELFDNLCDYDGLDDGGARDQSGAAAPGLGAYRVRVAVDTAAALGDLAGAPDLLRVDVRVTQGSADLALSGYRVQP